MVAISGNIVQAARSVVTTPVQALFKGNTGYIGSVGGSVKTRGHHFAHCRLFSAHKQAPQTTTVSSW